ncbi:hypothetical protein DL98DRAFT_518257 [Cadophora sp. DSE1049]|nr:hypothetical protein DL98DRAFT_518257 [Cadophora sp. DSE1049]
MLLIDILLESFLGLFSLVSSTPTVQRLQHTRQHVAREGPPQNYNKPCTCLKTGHWCDGRTGRGKLIGCYNNFSVYVCDKAPGPPTAVIDCWKTIVRDGIGGMCQTHRDNSGDVCADYKQSTSIH